MCNQVYVCPSLANLYENVNKNDWRLKYTGVPVLLHDKGSARSRAVPRVTFILAGKLTIDIENIQMKSDKQIYLFIS